MIDDNNSSSPDLARSIGDMVQANPLPAALIGAGAVWLLAGGGSSVKAGLHAMGDGMSARAGRRNDGARFDKEDRGNGLAFADESPQVFGAARQNIASLFAQQPLLLGAVGLGIGAAIAAAFRPTAIETDMLGAASANAQARAGKVANAAANQASLVVGRVTKAIGDEAANQGLTSADLKRSARDTGSKVTSVIGESLNKLQGAGADRVSASN